MKKEPLVVITLLVLTAFPVCAQTFNKFSLDGEAFVGNSYSIVRQDSTKNPKKFLNAKQWLSHLFPNYKDIIEFEDEAHGKIVLKGMLPVDYSMDNSNVNITYHPSIDFILTIDVKPEKYRLKLDNLIVTVVRREKAPLGDRISQAIFPISEYVAKFRKHSEERVAISASVTNFLNSAINTIEVVDDF